MGDLGQIFTEVYAEHRWGWPETPSGHANTEFYSGGGADPRNDRDGQYVKLVQAYVDRHDVNTVVEIGCGDWEIGRRIDWNGVDYTGYDVVKKLVDYNAAHYAKSHIEFVCADLMRCRDLRADLLIVKDVFQHLSPSYCRDFVRLIPQQSRYNLITNDYGGNAEIAPGEYGGNDFTLPPFEMRTELLLQWVQSPAAGDKRTWTLSTKEAM